jgi:hypothetical protein
MSNDDAALAFMSCSISRVEDDRLLRGQAR